MQEQLGSNGPAGDGHGFSANPGCTRLPDEVIDEVLTATARHNPALRGITLDRLKAEGAVPLDLETTVPFAGGRFPTPERQGRAVSRNSLADAGPRPAAGTLRRPRTTAAVSTTTAKSLLLVSPASHHFVSSSLASQPGLLKSAGKPFVEIHPDRRRGPRHRGRRRVDGGEQPRLVPGAGSRDGRGSARSGRLAQGPLGPSSAAAAT